jgi:hypothetical protein
VGICSIAADKMAMVEAYYTGKFGQSIGDMGFTERAIARSNERVMAQEVLRRDRINQVPPVSGWAFQLQEEINDRYSLTLDQLRVMYPAAERLEPIASQEITDHDLVNGVSGLVQALEPGATYLVWFPRSISPNRIEALRNAFKRNDIQAVIMAGVSTPDIFKIKDAPQEQTGTGRRVILDEAA